MKITGYTTRDIRFPTSLDKTGSDAMNEAGDYSAAFLILHTDTELEGHGMTFTIGRGNDVVCHALNYFGEMLKNKELSELTKDIGSTWKSLVSDSQLRWIGPEKGAIHLALGAAVNSLWDLWAKHEQKPVWKLVADMSVEEVVDLVDWRYLTDALTKSEAIEMLKKSQDGKQDRLKEVLNNKAVPAYTTSAGWLGYDDDKMRKLLKEAKDDGYKHVKLKVGSDLQEDKRRLRIAREELGDESEMTLMIDANQVWDVNEAIEYVKQLAEFKPWFIEEPTSPDDVLGHLKIKNALKPYGIKVATGEMCQNRIMFKQFLETNAIDICQVDACRLGGVNEVIAVLLLAKKFNIPVVPHSGGIGLPEYTQHVSTIDYLVVSGEKSLLENVDHLHEHFKYPSVVEGGYFKTPMEPGYSVEMNASGLDYEYPIGKYYSKK